MSRTENLPELKFDDDNIASIVKRIINEDTIIVTDSFGYPILSEYGRTIFVKNNNAENVQRVRGEGNYSRVIAVGGCTALDVGRAAAIGREVIAIPTILSTSCISVDRSVLNYDGQIVGEKTTAPKKVIVSLTSLLETPFDDLRIWTSSGFGDLFSNISASIDSQNENGNLTIESVKENVPEAFEAMEWVLEHFNGYDRNCLRILAQYLHNSSVDVIERGDTRLSAAGEHKFDYKLRELYSQFTEKKPTHGQTVAVGTLISVRISGEQTGDLMLYEKLKIAYRKLGLPTDYDGLRNIGIEKSHLIEGLKGIGDSDTYLGNYFTNHDYSVIDRVFGDENVQ